MPDGSSGCTLQVVSSEPDTIMLASSSMKATAFTSLVWAPANTSTDCTPGSERQGLGSRVSRIVEVIAAWAQACPLPTRQGSEENGPCQSPQAPCARHDHRTLLAVIAALRLQAELSLVNQNAEQLPPPYRSWQLGLFLLHRCREGWLDASAGQEPQGHTRRMLAS